MSGETQTGGTIPWPPGPAFTYKSQSPFVLGATLFVSPILLIPFGVYALLSTRIPALTEPLSPLLRGYFAGFQKFPALALVFIIIGATQAAMSVFMMKRMMGRFIPLAITDFGIFFYRGRRPWTCVPWENVRTISRLRTSPGRDRLAAETIEIEGRKATFSLNPQISGYQDAVGLLSRYARQHDIPLRFVDKGSDSIAAQRALLPREEWLKIRKTGVIEQVTQL